jgi:HSP20 family protein|tara:strand:+ start:1007 stop:1420 length:414 start_codon:yes stop_codon:yes gene_type:complete
MSTLELLNNNPFDILVRNFLQAQGHFRPIEQSKVPHPVDIYESPNGICIDIACTGIAKEDIDIQIQGNILRVIYDKPKTDVDSNYYHRGIAKRAFNLGWKIDSKFQLSKADASFENGLLRISIPFSKGSELKTLKIK